ncbi:MAG: hypothetical protein LC808_35600 [Actinobacteria bacterium]|nr:hypothetical protein [Actinomycetota bacterium]
MIDQFERELACATEMQVSANNVDPAVHAWRQPPAPPPLRVWFVSRLNTIELVDAVERER